VDAFAHTSSRIGTVAHLRRDDAATIASLALMYVGELAI
jgi:hypothetical protein